jgi:hypothetical protein
MASSCSDNGAADGAKMSTRAVHRDICRFNCLTVARKNWSAALVWRIAGAVLVSSTRDQVEAAFVIPVRVRRRHEWSVLIGTHVQALPTWEDDVPALWTKALETVTSSKAVTATATRTRRSRINHAVIGILLSAVAAKTTDGRYYTERALARKNTCTWYDPGSNAK